MLPDGFPQTRGHGNSFTVKSSGLIPFPILDAMAKINTLLDENGIVLYAEQSNYDGACLVLTWLSNFGYPKPVGIVCFEGFPFMDTEYDAWIPATDEQKVIVAADNLEGISLRKAQLEKELRELNNLSRRCAES